MKIFIKTTLLLSLILSLTACKQSFSDKEKELLEEAAQEVVKTNVNNSEVKKSTALYSTAFCNLITTATIQNILTDAVNFEVKEVKARTPECKITFRSGDALGGVKGTADIIIKGFNPRKKETARTFLERQIVSNQNHSKLEALGDEAYLFPHEYSSSVIVIKNNLSYYLRLNRYGENNDKKTVELMRAVIKNIK